jgi:hypothetical protein
MDSVHSMDPMEEATGRLILVVNVDPLTAVMLLLLQLRILESRIQERSQ